MAASGVERKGKFADPEPPEKSALSKVEVGKGVGEGEMWVAKNHLFANVLTSHSEDTHITATVTAAVRPVYVWACVVTDDT